MKDQTVEIVIAIVTVGAASAVTEIETETEIGIEIGIGEGILSDMTEETEVGQIAMGDGVIEEIGVVVLNAIAGDRHENRFSLVAG